MPIAREKAPTTEPRLAQVIEAMSDATLLVAIDESVLAVNRAAVRLFDLPLQEPNHLPFGPLASILGGRGNDGSVFLLAVLRRALSGEYAAPREAEITTSSGKRRPITLKATPIFSDSGNIEMAMLVAMIPFDASGQSLETPAPKEGEAQLILAQMPDACFRLDRQLRFTYLNSQAERLIRRSSNDLIGRSLLNEYPRVEYASLYSQLDQAIEKNTPTSFEAFFETLGIWLQARVFPDSNGPTIFLQDISERKLAENALRLSEERFRRSLDTMLDGFALISPIRDANGKIVDFCYEYINEAGCLSNCIDKEDYRNRALTTDLPYDLNAPLIDSFCRLAESGEPLTEEAYTVSLRKGTGELVAQCVDFRASRLGDGLSIAWREVTQREKDRAARLVLAEIVESSHDGIIGSDFLGIGPPGFGTIVSWNAGAERIFGYSASEAIGKPISMLVPPERVNEESEVMETFVIEAFTQGVNVQNYDTVRLRKDGILVDVSISISPIISPSGAIAGASTIVNDITERRRVEAALRDSEERYRGIVETAQEGIWILDAGENITLANTRIAEMLGYSVSELLGETIYRYLDEDSRWVAEADLALRRRGISAQHDIQFRRRDGTSLWATVSSTAIFDGNREYAGTVALVSDITERIEAEASLRQALEDSRLRQAQVSALLDGAKSVLEHRDLPDAAPAIFESCRLILGAESGYIQIFDEEGRPSELVLDRRKDGRDGDHSRQKSSEKRSLLRSPLEVDGRVVGELVLEGKPGGFSPEDARMATAFGDLAAVALRNGRLIESLKRGDEQLHTVLQSARDGIILSDNIGNIISWNQGAESIFGYTTEEAIGRPISILVSPSLGKLYHEQIFRIQRSFTTTNSQRLVEGIGVKKDGAEFFAEISLSPWTSDNGTFFTGVVRDVTARKLTEESNASLSADIAHERETLAAVYSGMSDGLLVLDSERRVCHCNARAGEILRFDATTAIGKDAAWLLQDINPDLLTIVNSLVDWKSDFQGKELGHTTFDVVIDGPSQRDIAVDLFQLVDPRGEKLETALVLHDKTGEKLLALLDERRRIEMDLHDGVIQSLYGIALQVGVQELRLDPESEVVRESLRRVRSQISGVIQEIRNYILDLRMRELGERGLRAGFEALAEELRVNALIRPQLELGADLENRLSSETVADLLNITREATSNVIRHAGATSVQIRLDRVSDRLALSIRDDGRGYDPSEARDRSSQGLRNMSERARRLGAELIVESQSGRGTVIRLEMPLGGDDLEEHKNVG